MEAVKFSRKKSSKAVLLQNQGESSKQKRENDKKTLTQPASVFSQISSAMKTISVFTHKASFTLSESQLNE